MKFKDMIYRRPDVEKLTEDLSQLTERFKKRRILRVRKRYFQRLMSYTGTTAQWQPLRI